MQKEFPVAMRLGVTPVPIPNTTVKPQAAESTTLETTWEARWLPEPLLMTDSPQTRNPLDSSLNGWAPNENVETLPHASKLAASHFSVFARLVSIAP